MSFQFQSKPASVGHRGICSRVKAHGVREAKKKGSCAAYGKLRFMLKSHTACEKQDLATTWDGAPARTSPHALHQAIGRHSSGSWLQLPATFHATVSRRRRIAATRGTLKSMQADALVQPNKVTVGHLVSQMKSGKRLHGRHTLALKSRSDDASQRRGRAILTSAKARLHEKAHSKRRPILTAAKQHSKLQAFDYHDFDAGNSVTEGQLAKLRIDTSRSYSFLQWRTAEQECAFIDSHGCNRRYFLHLPLNFQQQRRSRRAGAVTAVFPLLIYLHGSDGKSFFTHSKQSLSLEGTQFAAKHFVVLSPVCEWTWKHSPSEWIIELVEAFREVQWIDVRRIYLTGNSMGGMGTWEVASMDPDLFAAIVPVAAYHKPEKEDRIACQLKGVPVYVMHAKADKTCKMASEVQLWRKLEQGTTVCKNIMCDVDHTTIAEAAYYKSDELYKWLLKRKVEEIEDEEF